MKMFNLLKPLFLYAFLSLCSTACNDDDGHVPMPNPEAACRLTYINMPDEIPEGTHSYYTGIEYNEKGYVTRIYNTRDTDDDEIKFIYNTDNQIIRAESYTGELILYDTFEYTNGLLTTITEYTGSGDEDEFARSSVTINKYNSKKQLIESKSDDGSLISTYTSTYNSNGYPSEITEMRGKYTISNKYDYACK